MASARLCSSCTASREGVQGAVVEGVQPGCRAGLQQLQQALQSRALQACLIPLYPATGSLMKAIPG